MDTDDHGLFPGEVIRGNPRESAASVPPCLRGEGWLGGVGSSPFQGSGLMGVRLTQAFSLGSVISPRWGSKTWASLDRLFGAQRPRRTLPDLGSSLHFISH